MSYTSITVPFSEYDGVLSRAQIFEAVQARVKSEMDAEVRTFQNAPMEQKVLRARRLAKLADAAARLSTAITEAREFEARVAQRIAEKEATV